MKRQVECQSMIEQHIEGRGPTPSTGAVAPDVEKDEVLLLFYDLHETAHRNVYQIVLTPEEATGFIVGKTYELTIE